jgi:hypothetical protein
MSSPNRARLARVQSIHRGAEGMGLFAKLKLQESKNFLITKSTLSNLFLAIKIRGAEGIGLFAKNKK